jgi:hypothetical protein
LYYVATKNVSSVNEVYIYKSTNNGASWDGGTALTSSSSAGQSDPVIAITSDDVIHVAWWGWTSDGNYNIQYKKYSGGSWGSIVKITSLATTYLQRNVSMAIDSSDNIHLCWAGKTSASSGYYRLRYCKYSGGSWSGITDVVSDASYNQGYMCSIACTSNGNVHIVFNGRGTNYSNQIRYVKYTNAWQSVVEITDENRTQDTLPHIAIDSNDYIHLVWNGYNSAHTSGQYQIRYRKYTNSWQSIVELTNDGDYSQQYPSIALDYSNNIHVVWIVRESASVSKIYYKLYNGSWQSASVVLTGTNDYSAQVSLLWSNYPITSTLRTNQAKTGFCFAVRSDGDGQNIFGYSNDLTWETPVVAPTVTTQSATLVKMSGATGNGNITNNGGGTITEKGICYILGTSGTPTTADSTVHDHTDSTGAFTEIITGLLTGRAYRFRAYAINSAGTGYGDTVQVYTLTNFLQMFQ